MKVFVCHIPKTGGTSVKSIVESFFPPQNICPFYWLNDVKDIDTSAYDLNCGHIPYQHFVATQPTDLVSAITLRNPINRTLSHIAHLKRDSGSSLHRFVAEKSLVEILRSETGRSYFGDYICKFLGKPTTGINQQIFDFEDTTEDDYDRAIKVVDEADFVFSDHNDYAELNEFAYTSTGLKINGVRAPHLNVGTQSTYELTEQELDLLREICARDLKLYEIATLRQAKQRAALVDTSGKTCISQMIGFNPSDIDLNRKPSAIKFMTEGFASLLLVTNKKNLEFLFHIVYAESARHFDTFSLSIDGSIIRPTSITVLNDMSSVVKFNVNLQYHYDNQIKTIILTTEPGVLRPGYQWPQTIGFSRIQVNPLD